MAGVRIKRAEFLQRLEAVQPGLSVKDVLEQSGSFVFKGGYVITFNGEIAARTKSGLPKELEFSVVAKPLLSILNKVPDNFVEVEPSGKKFVMKGGKDGQRRRTTIRMSPQVLLPISKIEKPEVWKALPPNFAEAVAIVQECASKKKSKTAMECVHITERFIEACDNYQLTRYKIRTPVDAPILIKRDSIKHIVSLDMDKFSETKSWVHFRNRVGLTLSFLRYSQKFPDLSQLLLPDGGEPAKLPKGLGEAVTRCEVFSSEDKDNNEVIVSLSDQELKVEGVGASGKEEEIFDNFAYEGRPMIFQISPTLLVEITKRHNECAVSPRKMLVNGGKWTYATSLSKASNKKEPEDVPQPEPEDSDGEGDEGD